MEINYGFNGKILLIDLGKETVSTIEKDKDFYRLYGGGSLMGTYFLLNETKAGIDPLGSENLLMFFSSIIAGNEGPGLAKYSVTFKSPLSNGIGEARAEGTFGKYLKGSGFDGIIIKGTANKPMYIVINNGFVEFRDARFLWGKDSCYSTKELLKLYGSDTGVATIGVAGEKLVRFSNIVSDYSVHAMRMGSGAVMGSKKLKAIAIVGSKMPKLYDEKSFLAIKSKFEEDMNCNELSRWQKDAPGFSAALDLSDYDTAYIGSENYKSNLKVESSHFKRENYLKYYKGSMSCPGCLNDCIKMISDSDEDIMASGIHQEVTGALGPNIGNQNLELVLKANKLCNLYGVDPVSLGFTISFAMECFEKGLYSEGMSTLYDLHFGNEDILLDLIEDICERKTPLGDLLSQGSKLASETIKKGSEDYALQVKGVEMVSFEPRTQTNLALGYAIAPIGPRYDICEHDWDFDTVSGWEHTLNYSRTLGIFERIPMEYLGREKVRNFKTLYELWSACDSLNLCIFASAPTRLLGLETISRYVYSITGLDISSHEFINYGKRRNNLMKVYNLREGIGKEADTLPKRFMEKEIDYGRLKGIKLDEKKFNSVIEFLYGMFGWDKEGIPHDETLYELHLEWAIEHLNRES